MSYIRSDLTGLCAAMALLACAPASEAQMCEWQAVGSGVNTSALAMTTFDEGTGEQLVMGGIFQTAGANTVRGLARWDGTQWDAIGTGFDGEVRALSVFDDGGGDSLYAGGFIFIGGGAFGNRVARWDGNSWTGLGTQFNGKVYALQAFDDGSGSAMYAAGAFTSISGSPVNYVAKWTGTQWVPLNASGNPGGDLGGPFARINALAVFDDGSGPALYIGGQAFTVAGLPGEHRIAKWDGTAWTALTPGIDNSIVHALEVFQGSLYVAGSYLGQPDRPGTILSKWTGSAWEALPAEPDNTVFDLASYDLGMGEVLYATGSLQAVGGNPTSFIAGWDGAAWHTFSGANDIVWTAKGHDDGSGPALYAGGNFITIGDGVSASRVARFACANDCPGDLADSFGSVGPDGLVDFGDFLALLGLVGPCPGGTPGCMGDIADSFGTLPPLGGADGAVDFGDFLALLGIIGPCP